jgi:hypothetical protein
VVNKEEAENMTVHTPTRTRSKRETPEKEKSGAHMRKEGNIRVSPPPDLISCSSEIATVNVAHSAHLHTGAQGTPVLVIIPPLLTDHATAPKVRLIRHKGTRGQRASYLQTDLLDLILMVIMWFDAAPL